MPTDTSEKGLESLIVNWLTTQNGYEQGANADYNREYTVDEQRLFGIMMDHTVFFKQFSDNPHFKKWLSDFVFNATYNAEGKPLEGSSLHAM